MLKNTIIISLVFFLLLISIVVIHYIITDELTVETTYVFIALIPFIIMLFLSGKLAEISGPGGLGLVLRNEAKSSVSPSIDEPFEFDESRIMQKGATNMLSRIFTENPPSTLSFHIGKRYSEEAIRTYLEELSKFPSFQNVVLNSYEGKFEGFVRAEDFKSLVYNLGIEIESEIQDGRILNNPRVIKSYILRESTNQEVLREMDRVRLNVLAVTDSQSRFVGIVSQEEIVRKILTKVVQEA